MAMRSVSMSHHRPVAPHSVMPSEHTMRLSEAARPSARLLAGMWRLRGAEQQMAVSSAHMCGQVRAGSQWARPWADMCGLVQAEVRRANLMVQKCCLVQVAVLTTQCQALERAQVTV